jgi:hypothetical protein
VSTKVLSRWFVISSLVMMILLLWVGIAPVRADCGGPQSSSCITCHALVDTVSEKGEWHSIHASKDICIKCHGGNGSTMDKNLAHEGLVVNPLNDIYTDCHSCHPNDYVERAELFAVTMGVTPGSCATSTPIPVSITSGEPPSGSINIPTNLVGTTSSPQPFLVIGAILSILTLFLFALGLLNSHREKF